MTGTAARDRGPGPADVDRGMLESHLGGAAAANYRRFELDLVSPHCGRHILEVGSGLGEFAAGLRGYDRLTVSDTDPLCLRALRERFAARADVDVVRLDIAGPRPGDPGGPGGVDAGRFDTLIMMNVLEHIDEDVAAVRRLARLLGAGGRMVLWVPAYPALYGEFDRRVGHVRRYTPTTLRHSVRSAGLRVVELRPVNLLGGIAWWAAVRCARRRTADPRLVEIYDRIVVPATRLIERWAPVPFGQSLLCVARAPGSGPPG